MKYLKFIEISAVLFLLVGGAWAQDRIPARLEKRLGQIHIGADYYIDTTHALNRPRSAYEPYALDMAQRYGIPDEVFLNLITVESGWHDGAKSYVGAMGLTQLMPGTAKDLGVNPWEPFENIEGGARYLKSMYQTFGSWNLALAAYNAGPGAVKKYGGVPPYAETQAYVKKILGKT